MGLYDHSGTLLINDQPLERYKPAQLHARTTCCFQDHGKYSLTVRENIGLGNVAAMSSEVAIDEAITRGGAEEIKTMFGLSGRLNKDGIPDLESAANMSATSDINDSGKAVSSAGETPMKVSAPAVTGQGTEGDKSALPPATAARSTTMASRERGKREPTFPLSGGQWQRLALARAFMRADDADLVVFE